MALPQFLDFLFSLFLGDEEVAGGGSLIDRGGGWLSVEMRRWLITGQSMWVDVGRDEELRTIETLILFPLSVSHAASNKWLSSLLSSPPSAIIFSLKIISWGRLPHQHHQPELSLSSTGSARTPTETLGIHWYRAMNSGKFPTVSDALKEFPTVSDALKEVGGSYYRIRKIVQELEYDSKISAMNARNDTLLEKEVAQEDEMSVVVEKVSRHQMTAETEIHTDVQMSSETLLTQEVAQENESCAEVEVSKNQISSLGDNSLSHQTKAEGKGVLHPCREKPVDNIKEKTSSEEIMDFEGSKPQYEQQRDSLEVEKSVKVLSEERAGDEELRRKQSIWGNLRSLADGIINIWRKL
ncbi:unnamed protein product [Ilex paraguariensis]|uniref:AT3G52170-like helix-turn-helix domain-containing protein n=1 Tax=Ilex paraguariensis TaxID=185542 RepID=A0ABC8R3M8_9AQUA